MSDDSLQAGAEIVVTPEMIEAGVAELRERVFGECLHEVVIDVFIAMASQQYDSASETRAR